jgi:DNA-binding GntR family transcriptional regulator
LYKASGNPVLMELIRALWNRCRAYKIVGAQGSINAGEVEPLWKYQLDLVAAARKNDAAATAAVNDASLVDATARIKERLAAQAEAPNA